MFGKKEDKSKLPDLPPSPIPMRSGLGVPSRNINDISSLPSFPEGPRDAGFSQAAIKGAVGESEEEDFVGRSPSNMGVVEMEEWKPGDFNVPKHEDNFELPEKHSNSGMIAPPPERVERKEIPVKAEAPKDVFIRIDKFHAARKALSDVKDRLGEVDEFVRKIREVKMREEQELAGWEKDIMHIKTRVQSVSENIFEKVE